MKPRKPRQWVWWGFQSLPHRHFPWIYNIGAYPKSGPDAGVIYRKRMIIGPFEVRWWNSRWVGR